MVNDTIADNMLQQILSNPGGFDVIATTNLNGDYLSDALAAQVGGLGIAPGANINFTTGRAIFEATHGTAPDLAGKDLANPSSLILSGVMMFDHVGWHTVADDIAAAVEKTILDRVVTSDLARLMPGTTPVRCSEFAREIVDRLETGSRPADKPGTESIRPSINRIVRSLNRPGGGTERREDDAEAGAGRVEPSDLGTQGRAVQGAGTPARVRVLELLIEGERSVSDMQPIVGIETSHLSQQLGVLRRAGLLVTRKEGSSVIYAISDPQLIDLLAVAKRILINSLAHNQGLLAGLRAGAGRA